MLILELDADHLSADVGANLIEDIGKRTGTTLLYGAAGAVMVAVLFIIAAGEARACGKERKRKQEHSKVENSTHRTSEYCGEADISLT